MNIFILDNDPVIAAQMQCDKHVVKMIVESAQMLSTVHRMIDGIMETRLSKKGRRGKYYKLDDDREDILYKAVHHNHPCTVWSRENCQNYEWHYLHFVALCEEYTHRYGKKHSTDTKLRYALEKPPKNINHTMWRTPFRLAMGSNPECVVSNLGGTNAVESYRNFYHTKQKRFKMDWTNRITPEWFEHANV